MEGKGFHTERVASSGKRVNSVCDVVLFKLGQAYLAEVKATKFDKLRLDREQKEQLLRVSIKHSIPALYAVRFKGKYNGNRACWVVKQLTHNLIEVHRNENWDTF